MGLKRSIKIILKKQNKDGKPVLKNLQIRFRVSYNGNRVDLFSGYRVDAEHWDETKSRVREGVINKSGQTSEEINIALSEFEIELDKFFLSYSVEDKIPSPKAVREKFKSLKRGNNPESNQKKEEDDAKHSFFEVFDEFTTYRGKVNDWTKDTYTKFATIKSHFMNFNPNLKFEDLDEEGLTDLLLYFSRNQKMRNRTTKKYFEFIKWFLRYAYDKKYTTNDAFLTFKPKLKRTKKKVIFLTEEEINKIRGVEIPSTKQYLERVRDVLIFLCYSGLRHSDVYRLKKSDIHDGKFEVTTLKTNDSLIIELNDTTRAILKKYEDDPTIKNGKALPVISNQKTNDYLKELAELAEIDEPITETYFIGNKRFDTTQPKSEFVTSHIGRRSFICLCIAKEIPIQVIMKWTGHSDYKSMIPYIEVAGKTKAEQMKKLNF